MPSSPYASTSTHDVGSLKESPSRYHDRYNERFKSISSTPPRESTTQNRSSQTNSKRPSYIDEYSPEQASSPRPTTVKSTVPPPTKEIAETQLNESDLPAYMQTTHSFSRKIQSKKEPRQKDNLLRPRSQGGITKRVSTAKIPRYQSTTKINAIEDIKNEMKPEDVYIPLAARVKLFEKELGNGSNKPPAPIVHRYSSTSTIKSESPVASPKPTPRRSESRLPSTSSTTGRSSIRSQTHTDEIPHYAQQTTVSMIKQQQAIEQKELAATHISKELKPFHFSTSDYIQPSDSFKEKLNLWRHKDKQATIENQQRLVNNASKKRKRQEQEQTKHAKYKYQSLKQRDF